MLKSKQWIAFAVWVRSWAAVNKLLSFLDHSNYCVYLMRFCNLFFCRVKPSRWSFTIMTSFILSLVPASSPPHQPGQQIGASTANHLSNSFTIPICAS